MAAAIFSAIFAKIPANVSLLPTQQEEEGDVNANAAPGSPEALAAKQHQHPDASESDDDDGVDLVKAAQKRQRAAAARRQQQQVKRNTAAATMAGPDGEGQAENAEGLELLEDDEAIKDALTFQLASTMDIDEYLAAERREEAQRVAAAAAEAASAALAEMEADDGKRYRGKCAMFNATKGFGFIKPSNGQSDVYFTRESIRRGELSELCAATGEPRPVPLMLFPDEEVEFLVTNNENAKKLKALDVTGIGEKPVRAESAQVAKRHEGKVRHWDQSKLYGFITPTTAGEQDVFFHASQVNWDAGIVASMRSMSVGMVVEYSAYDRPGQKPCGVNISGKGNMPVNPRTMAQDRDDDDQDNGADTRQAEELDTKRTRYEDAPLFAAPPPAYGTATAAPLMPHPGSLAPPPPPPENDGYADW